MLNEFSVYKLNKLSRNREVWCWGGGFQYGRMINNYLQESFVNAIVGLLDSNESIHGTCRTIIDKTITIYPPRILLKKKEKYLLIISSDSYVEIYNQAKKIFEGLDIIYTKYPAVYYSINNLFKKFFCRIPFKRQILMYVGTGASQPHENSDEIVHYLIEKYTGVPYILVYLTDCPCTVPEGVIQISLSDIEKKNSLLKVLRYHYYYCCSKFILFESKWVDKYRKEQISFYLNHGTIPLKYVKDALKQPEDLDYAICPGAGCAKFYEEQYSIDRSKLIYIMPPRERQLFVDKSELIDDLFQIKNKQLILWLPTFRKMARGDTSERRDSEVESPLFELVHSREIMELDACLEGNGQFLIIKCHPREKDSLIIDDFLANIKVITDEKIINEGVNLHNLLNRADALISDYSGITFEYMLLDRPIGYYIPDYDDYSRGFSVDNPLDYMPGQKMYNKSDLINFLTNVKLFKDEYGDDRRSLVENLFSGNNPMTGIEELVVFFDSIMEKKESKIDKYNTTSL